MVSNEKVIIVEDGWKNVPLKDLDKRDVIGKLLMLKNTDMTLPSVEAIHENDKGVRRYFLRNAMCKGYSNTFVSVSNDISIPRHTCFSFFCDSVSTLMSCSPKIIPNIMSDDDRKKRKKIESELFVIKKGKKMLESDETEVGAKMTKIEIELSEEIIIDKHTVDFLSNYLGKENRDPIYPELVTHMMIELEEEKNTDNELVRLKQVCLDFI